MLRGVDENSRLNNTNKQEDEKIPGIQKKAIRLVDTFLCTLPYCTVYCTILLPKVVTAVREIARYLFKIIEGEQLTYFYRIG